MDTLLTIAPFAIIALCIGGLLWLVRPDLLAWLVWPAFLLYPKHLLHGTLPLNAGLNDVFILALGVRMLFYQSGDRDGVVRRWGLPIVALAVGLAVMQFVSEVCGALTVPGAGQWQLAVKDGLKGLVFISTSLIFVKTITNEKSLRQHLLIFSGTIAIAFLLVWVCTWSSTAKWVFEDMGSERNAREYAYVQATRTWGPFDFTSGLGIMIAATFPLGISLAATAKGDGLLRVISIAMVAGSLVAELITKTRSALTGIAVVLLCWIVLSRHRLRVAAILVVIGGIAVSYGVISGQASALGTRLESERAVSDYDLRADLWKTVVQNPSPLILAFGEGETAMYLRLHLNPHNGYLDALFIWGIGGLTLFILLYGCTIRWARTVSKFDHWATGRGVGWGVLWSCLAIAVTSLTSDTWFNSDYRVLMYFVLAMLWQRKEALLQETLSGGSMQELSAPDYTYVDAYASSRAY